MAEGDTQNTGRLTNWIILVIVLVVMGLLIADLGSNVMAALDRNDRPNGENATAPAAPDGRGPTPQS